MLGIDPAQLIARIIVLVIAFTIHEFAHAWTADQLGDDTPRMNGRLTLNPLAHVVVCFRDVLSGAPCPVMVLRR